MPVGPGDFPNGTRVEVRASADPVPLPWRAGEVTDDSAVANGECWRVTLDAPVTANDWEGKTRRYGGSEALTIVDVFKQSDQLDQDALIRLEP